MSFYCHVSISCRYKQLLPFPIIVNLFHFIVVCSLFSTLVLSTNLLSFLILVLFSVLLNAHLLFTLVFFHYRFAQSFSFTVLCLFSLISCRWGVYFRSIFLLFSTLSSTVRFFLRNFFWQPFIFKLVSFCVLLIFLFLFPSFFSGYCLLYVVFKFCRFSCFSILIRHSFVVV